MEPPPRILPFVVDLTDQRSVVVGGVDVTSAVDALAVYCKTGQEPHLRLELNVAGVLEGIGVVEVAMPATSDQEAAARWLEGIDAAVLSDAVLNKDGIDRDPIGLALDILREWAGAG